jgi:hypothetical protein
MFNHLYDKILGLLAPLKSGNYFQFVFGILRSWYVYMTVASVYVVYHLFKALINSGILAGFTRIVTSIVNSVLIISHDCFPLITDLRSMFECIRRS